MRIYQAVCLALALTFGGLAAHAQTLEGTRTGRIVSSKQDGQHTDINFLGTVQITPHYISYTRTCAMAFVGRDGTTLGAEIAASDMPPQPAIECVVYPQDVAMFAEITAGVDEMRYQPGLEFVFIYRDGEEVIVVELLS